MQRQNFCIFCETKITIGTIYFLKAKFEMAQFQLNVFAAKNFFFYKEIAEIAVFIIVIILIFVCVRPL